MVSSQQIVLVVAKDMNTSHAKLQCFEDGQQLFDTINVNLGKNGLGWGIGKVPLVDASNKNIIKYEGDKKAPAGIFELLAIFGYSQKSNYNLPYLYASQDLICVDDGNSSFYNQIITPKHKEKSFEYMRRKDNQYKIGIVVGHNQEAKRGRGSCIFMHIEHSTDVPTVGCTSMKESDIKKIAQWLDKDKKPILIQIPKSTAKKVLKLYPELKSSKLLY
ncbi:L,D-transpeptidase family protein [Sulfurimonas sp.]|uniref:L,D-transpeptidase family protein n=1 Tax=Sulfurimonas sp. TaxID=2022749 RepID=UPI0026057755|nr:L,D-transpeptidase family protein [Sulfurimonas sp.]